MLCYNDLYTYYLFILVETMKPYVFDAATYSLFLPLIYVSVYVDPKLYGCIWVCVYFHCYFSLFR